MTSPPPQPLVTVFFQEKCLSHRYIRSQDTSRIHERPQRLRAVKTGVAAAIARLEEQEDEERVKRHGSKDASGPDEATLSAALERLDIVDRAASGGVRYQREGVVVAEGVIEVVMSAAPSVDVLSHPAVRYVHGGSGDGGDDPAYPERLVALVKESEEKVALGESEIPEGLCQDDLYLCGESLDAIQGGIATVCEAVDAVLVASPPPVPSESSKQQQSTKPSSGRETSRAFAVIRPPGHHCGMDTPSGFCFMNNVAIGVAHAHIQHGVSRVVILDIDLHHGNGTQSLVWRINAEAHRQQLDAADSSELSPPLRVYYGSIHDALSYPCEDGNPAIIQAASVSIHGPHGQYIENVHLSTYDSEADFWNRLYAGPYARLLEKAEAFLKHDMSSGEAMIFISAGFDASEHETPKMSRYGRKLPTGFYRRFTRDVRTLADKYARGRIVSVLEGGYSDRALCSAAMAHVLGLAERNAEVDESWWSMENLAKIESSVKKRRGGRSSMASVEKWVERMLSLLSIFDPNPSPPPTPKPIPPSTMTLRDRNKLSGSMTPSGSQSGSPAKVPSPAGVYKYEQTGGVDGPAVDNDTGASVKQDVPPVEEIPAKKLPRVLLRVNPPAPSVSGHPPG